jgi:AhpD family alkylhydroperoxidase
MTATERVDAKNRPDATARLQDLIPIAVVIAAGCESCAESTVKRALRNGAAPSQIERTLRIVAHFRSAECFQQAVGTEVTRRMEGPLAAGANALRERDAETEAGACCGTSRASAPRDSV